MNDIVEEDLDVSANEDRRPKLDVDDLRSDNGSKKGLASMRNENGQSQIEFNSNSHIQKNSDRAHYPDGSKT